MVIILSIFVTLRTLDRETLISMGNTGSMVSGVDYRWRDAIKHPFVPSHLEHSFLAF